MVILHCQRLRTVSFINDIRAAQAALLKVPLLQDTPIRTKYQLHIFMEHHIFAVWDFMCLTKALQHHVAPSGSVWIPQQDATSARLINEIVLTEESDVGLGNRSYQSHFNLYVDAMEEVGASTAAIDAFQRVLRTEGFDTAASLPCIPGAASRFMRSTLAVVNSGKPWMVCAAFTFGREAVIPIMFKALKQNKVLQLSECPAFSYYLERHIEIDGGTQNEEDGHGAMAIQLLNHLCDGQSERYDEAKAVALDALQARKRLWEEVYTALIAPEQSRRA